MEYLEFVKKAICQDERNIFSKYKGALDIVPEELKAFYKENNPLNIEVNSVRFVPAEELVSMQEEYSYLKAQFVFASCNGDPIFLHNGYIYTCPHGVKNPEWELLSKDFKIYLSSLVM